MDFVTPKHRIIRSPDGNGPAEEFAPDVPFRPRDQAELDQLRADGVLYDTTDPNLIEQPSDPQLATLGTAADAGSQVPVEERPPVQEDD